MPERPDFVLSGINHGQNMGEDVLYSGTVAAAMEGLALGIPSIAFSFAGGDLRADLTHLQEQVERPHAACSQHLTSLPAFPREHAAQREPAAGPAGRREGRAAHAARQPRVLRLAQADARSVGSRDLLDRRRIDQWTRRAGLGLPGDPGRLHLRSRRCTSTSRTTSMLDDRGDLVAGARRRRSMRGARRRLVETLREKGIRDLAVLRAFDLTPRHAFVPTGVRAPRVRGLRRCRSAAGRRSRSRRIHARYLEMLQLKGSERVLEIGTGSGYQTVLLSHLVAQVFTIERMRRPAGSGARRCSRSSACATSPCCSATERSAGATMRRTTRIVGRRRRAGRAAAATSSSSRRAGAS